MNRISLGEHLQAPNELEEYFAQGVLGKGGAGHVSGQQRVGVGGGCAPSLAKHRFSIFNS